MAKFSVNAYAFDPPGALLDRAVGRKKEVSR